MSAPVFPLYGDNDRVLKDIDLVGTTVQNSLDLVTRSNEDASLELQSLFNGNIDFTGATNLTLPDWFVELVVELQTSYFWVKSNNTEEARTQREEVRAKARMTLEKRFKPAFSTI